MIFPLLTQLLSPAGGRARLTVLLFHRVLPHPDPLLPSEVDQARFAQMIGWVKEQFTVLEPEDACARMVTGTLPARAAIITFDDGYRDNFDIALPILQRLKAPAAFFIATGFLDGSAMFNDCVIEAIRRTERDHVALPDVGLERVPLGSVAERRAAVDTVIGAVKYLEFDERAAVVERLLADCGVRRPTDVMMDPEQIRGLRRAGMAIGGHTRTHPILNRVAPERARDEIVGCRTDLSAVLDHSPTMFAYPNGRPDADYGTAHVDMVRAAGFAFAFSTRVAIAGTGSDPLQIPRIIPWDRTALRFKARMLTRLSRTAA